MVDYTLLRIAETIMGRLDWFVDRPFEWNLWYNRLRERAFKDNPEDMPENYESGGVQSFEGTKEQALRAAARAWLEGYCYKGGSPATQQKELGLYFALLEMAKKYEGKNEI